MTTALVKPESVVSNNAIQWKMMRDQLNYINRMAMDDLISVVRTASQMDSMTGREYLTDAFEALVSTYGGVSADMTVEWWDEIMADELYLAEAAPLPTHRQLVKEVRWGTAPDVQGEDDVLRRMAALMQKHIFGAHRNTVDINSLNHKVGYARYAQADACAFCRLLASRGAVYGSPAAALYVGTATVRAHYSDGRRRGYRLKQGRVRGVQRAGERYHDHCRCVVAPNHPGLDPNLPDYVDKFEEEYDRAIAQLDKDNPGEVSFNLSQVTRMMRLQGSGK